MRKETSQYFYFYNEALQQDDMRRRPSPTVDFEVIKNVGGKELTSHVAYPYPSSQKQKAGACFMLVARRAAADEYCERTRSG
jgi:hypothetical protein